MVEIFKSFCLLNACMSLMIANSADTDEIAASYLSLQCLLTSHLWEAQVKCVNKCKDGQ